MAVGAVGVEGDLGVEHGDLAVAGADQGVDLDQVGVGVGVGAVELQQRLGGGGGDLVGQGGFDPGPAGRLSEALDRVYVDAGDGVGVGLGHRLDLDPALGRQHPQVAAGRAVQGEAGVVLLSDVGRLLDQQPLHGVAGDVEAEDGGGAGPRLVEVGGQLHPAGLAPAPGVDLGLDRHRGAQAAGRFDGLLGGEGDLAGGHRQPVAGQELLALMLEEIHEASARCGVRAILGGRRDGAPIRPAAGAGRITDSGVVVPAARRSQFNTASAALAGSADERALGCVHPAPGHRTGQSRPPQVVADERTVGRVRRGLAEP